MKIKTIDQYPLTLDEAKNYLRVDITDDDDLINGLISASMDAIYNETNRDFVPTTYTMTVWSGSGNVFLTMQDVDTVSTGSLNFAGGASYVYFDAPYSGELTYTVEPSGSFPPAVIHATRMMLGQWYDYRTLQTNTRTSDVVFGVSQLLSPYKLVNP